MITNFSTRKHGNELLNILYSTGTYVHTDVLIQQLGISRRSLFYLIKNVNTELDNHAEFPIANVKNLGYYLPRETIQYLSLFDDDQPKYIPTSSPEERRSLIIFLLLGKSHLSLIELANQFHISKNTIIRDIKIIQNLLSPYSLEITNERDGKSISGNPIEVRRWVYDHSSVLSIFSASDESISRDYISDQIILFERITGKYLTDNARNNLINFLVWHLNRLQDPAYQLSGTDSTTSTLSLDSTWATSLLRDCDVENSFEADYLVKLINSSQFSHANWDDPLLQKLKPIAARMISDFNHLSGANVSIKAIADSLAVHLLSTYYRVIYSMPYEYPDLNSIKEDYSQTFEITKKVADHFEYFINSKLSDDEVALIAIYFGGAVREQKQVEEPQREVLVVCSSGIGTSRLLLRQLQTRYGTVRFSEPMNILQYENASLKNIKLVISTIKLTKRDDTPVTTVSAFPSELEWKVIDDSLVQAGLVNANNSKLFDVDTLLDIVENYAKVSDSNGLKTAFSEYITQITQAPFLNLKNTKNSEFSSLLPSHHIGYLFHQDSWEQATRSALAPLVEDYSVEKSYVDKIISLTKNNGPYMAIGQGVMLAHAAPRDGVNTLGATLFLLDQPVNVLTSDKPIKLIIGLAPIDQEQHLKFLSELMAFLQDNSMMNQLFKSKNRQELIKVISSINYL